MARRLAIGAFALLLTAAAPACKFSRSTNDNAAPADTTESTVEVLGDITSVPEETTTTEPSATTTSRRTATTARPAAASATRSAAAVATTARPTTTIPHCTASAGDTYYGGSWTVTVNSTFPNSNVVVDIKWPGGSGNYSGITDPSGTWVKTQRVQPSMRGQTVYVTASVGGRSCSTSFKVS